MTPDGWLADHGDELIAIRRHLHAHPELSGSEYATTDYLDQRLRAVGLTPRRLSSGTGLVCDIGEPDGRPLLALRADIDGLGMVDEKDVPYRSQIDGVCHACGHDVHTTVMLGVALMLASHPDLLSAPLRIIFQPAEERVPGGALDVLADGGLDGVGAIVGFHCDPKLEVGKVGLKAGALTSAADLVEIHLAGPGGHTARPDETVDMVSVAARLLLELPERVRALAGTDALRFVFGAIHAGDAANVIPSTCTLRAAVRTPDLEVWEQLGAIVEKATGDALDGSGCEYGVQYTHGVPPVANDAELIELVRRAAAASLGAQAITDAVRSWGGDDFGWYTREVPGAYVRLGVRDPSAQTPPLDLHAGRFDVDERSIAVGVRLAIAAAAAFQGQP